MNSEPYNFGIDTRPCPMPIWLPEGHSQTIFAAMFAHRPNCLFVRERIKTTDDDFIDIDWTGRDINTQRALPDDNVISSSSQPALILFHGLEGSSQSHYALTIAKYFSQAGWLVCIPHFRGCSGQINRLPRAYHSGDTTDAHEIIEHVQRKAPNATWHAAGVSLGGNVLLKYLAEQQNHTKLKACAAISTPMNLLESGKALSQGLNHWLYGKMFLRTLKAKALEKANLYPGSLNIEAIQQARDLYEFDNVYTAPIHGYTDTIDYWTKASSKPLLKDIRTPTLILNARNDPFYPAHALPSKEEVSPHVTLHQPSDGGHVGFMDKNANLSWLAIRLEHYLVHGH